MHCESLLIKKKLAYVSLPWGYYKLFIGSALGLLWSFHYMKLAGGANKHLGTEKYSDCYATSSII